MSETDKLAISQINKYLDLIVLWTILYLWLDWEVFQFGIMIGAFLVIAGFILFFYNKDLQDQDKDRCFCKNCVEDYMRIHNPKYDKRTITDKYWESKQKSGETIQQTQIRVSKEQELYKKQKNQKKWWNFL